MAVSDKNILITPNISGILGNQPSVVFTGADSSIGDSAAITATANPENSGTLNFSASEGQLFSISNNLTDGDIFTVNDVSGIPSLAIGANGIVKIAEYSGRILLGGATDDSTNLLQVNGHIQLSDFDATGSVGALKFGNDSSLKIYKLASNNNAVISNNHSTGDLLYLSHLHSFRNAGNTEVMANFIENGAVELNFNNNKSFETRNLGFMYEDSNVLVDVGNQSNFGVIELGGSAGAFIDMKTPKGEDYDFRMQLTSSNTALIQSDDLHIQSKTGAEDYLDATVNGAVRIYHDNVKKLETTAYGATVTGTINADSATINNDIRVTGSVFIAGSGGIGATLGNTAITQVNYLQFNDAGVNEGISWNGGNTQLFESPDDLSNAAGNLQVTHGGAKRFTVSDSGANITGTLRVNNAEIASGASAGFAIAMAIAL